MRISLLARPSSAKSEIRVSLVNNGALWLIRHVATTVVNRRDHETEKEGSLPRYSQRVVLCVYRGVSYRTRVGEFYSALARYLAMKTQFETDMIATPTTPPTTRRYVHRLP